MKLATKQGVGRALNEAGVFKAGLRTTRIKGYSEQTSGWTSSETETGFVVKYHYAQNSWRTPRSTTDQRFENAQKFIASRTNQNLQVMLVALVAKGFDAVLIGETIVITNGHRSND